MLLGVWLTGGLFMTFGAMASGSEFTGATGVWRLLVVAVSVIPIVTYILSAYDGSIFALLAVTAGALLLWSIRMSWTLLKSPVATSELKNKTSELHESDKAT